jgi:hypothetical protein
VEIICTVRDVVFDYNTPNEYGSVAGGRLVVEGPLSTPIQAEFRPKTEDGPAEGVLYEAGELEVDIATFIVDDEREIVDGMQVICMLVWLYDADSESGAALVLKKVPTSPGVYERVGKAYIGTATASLTRHTPTQTVTII